jgi:hypothetical protein
MTDVIAVDGTTLTWVDGIRWRRIAGSALIILVGVLLYDLVSNPDLKNLGAGTLAGFGIGAVITEILDAGDRRSQALRFQQLLAPARARGRAAYRFADLQGKAINAVTQGDADARPVHELLVFAEALQIRGTVQEVIDSTRERQLDPTETEGELSAAFWKILWESGKDVWNFHELHDQIETVRELHESGDAWTEASTRSAFLQPVQELLTWAGGYTDDVDAAQAWRNFGQLWARDALTWDEVRDVIDAFDAYFMLLGLNDRQHGNAASSQDRRWDSRLSDLAHLSDPGTRWERRLGTLRGAGNAVVRAAMWPLQWLADPITCRVRARRLHITQWQHEQDLAVLLADIQMGLGQTFVIPPESTQIPPSAP